jgi:hypothetical protein
MCALTHVQRTALALSSSSSGFDINSLERNNMEFMILVRTNPDIDEAEAWVKRCPNPMPVASEIEISPI